MSESAGKAVFLSYASQDVEAARRIAEALRGAGIEVWLDQEGGLVGGDAWDRKIREQIATCALFVPVISAHTQQRLEGYFRLEWKLAAQRTHTMADEKTFLLPVVIDSTRDADGKVPVEFRAVQWTKLPGGETTPAFVTRVQKLLAGPGAPTTLSAPFSSQPSATAPAAKFGLPLWGTVALGAVVLALIGYIITRPGAKDTAPAPKSVAEAKTAPAAVPASVPLPNDKSIAVLPFENLSDDKTSGYFADGVQEDIIANLTFIRDLKVVPRPTAMRYRDSKQPIRQIAQELGVAYVLLGTVRKSGDKVRITGTLMNGRSEEQLWMKPFEKNLTDQFAIQAALATEIAGALSAVISPEAQKLIRRVPTENAVAYDKYLQARERMNSSGGPSSRARAAVLLQEAVELDPTFAVAWAWLAEVHGQFYLGRGGPGRLKLAKDAIDKAVRLAPGDPDVIFNLGLSYYHESRDYARALEQFERGARVQPGAAIWNIGTGEMQRRTGNFADSLANYRRAAELDPGNRNYAFEVRFLAIAGRRFDDELAALPRAADVKDDPTQAAFSRAHIRFLREGSTREMEAAFAGVPADGEQTRRRTWAATIGNYAEAIHLAKSNPSFQWIENPAPGMGGISVGRLNQSFEIALCFAATGDLAAARDRMAKLAPRLREQLETEPGHASLLGALGCVEAVLGNAQEALRCAQEAMRLVPETIDKWMGPTRRVDLAFVYAWTGDKERAIAEYRRVLRTAGANSPAVNFGVVTNVHVMKRHPAYFPLQGDPRFQALLADPKNNAPLF